MDLGFQVKVIIGSENFSKFKFLSIPVTLAVANLSL